MLSAAAEIVRPGGRLFVIHWRHDAGTPRGPDLTIRPRPEQILGWATLTGRACAPQTRWSTCRPGTLDWCCWCKKSRPRVLEQMKGSNARRNHGSPEDHRRDGGDRVRTDDGSDGGRPTPHEAERAGGAPDAQHPNYTVTLTDKQLAKLLTAGQKQSATHTATHEQRQAQTHVQDASTPTPQRTPTRTTHRSSRPEAPALAAAPDATTRATAVTPATAAAPATRTPVRAIATDRSRAAGAGRASAGALSMPLTVVAGDHESRLRLQTPWEP